MKQLLKWMLVVFAVLTVLFCAAAPAFAAEDANAEPATTASEAAEAAQPEDAEQGLKRVKAICAAIIIAVGATAGAVSMALSIRKSVDGISRQPESAGNIRTSLMLGLVFIETAIIYALIVAILIIFVL